MKMHPDVETLRRTDYQGHSYLESNCNQIFLKGPALTKEIFEKVNAEIMPKKTYLFGYELKTKKVLLTCGLCLLFLMSFVGTTAIWFTNAFDDFTFSQLVLENNSKSFNMWRRPSAHAIYKIYIFNYTNLDDFNDKYVDKLQVDEVGPYTYEERLERIDISFPTEDTISYREKREFKFRPDLSNGQQDDQVIVPNLPVIGGSAATKSKGYFKQLAFSALLGGINEEAFLTISAESFITGYKDRLYSFARNFLPYDTPEKIGLLVSKMGETPFNLTINTGKNDINKLARTEKFNGETQFNYYSDITCNSIEGTDGALHSPKKVQAKQPLYYFFPHGCRRMPLIFEKESTVLNGKVPAYQYIHPENIFDTVDENPDNGCYCSLNGEECPLKGVFNVTTCNFGSPMFMSHPHFHRGDPRLIKPFMGLHPERQFKSYFKFHPTMGFAMKAKNYLQFNIQLQKAPGLSQVDMLEDGIILPIAYLEAILDDKSLPQEVIDTINLVTFAVPSIKSALKYGSLLTAITTMVCLILVLRRSKSPVKKMRQQSLISNGQGFYEAS